MGNLKEVHSKGFQGQDVVHSFYYTDITLGDSASEGGTITVALLDKVQLPDGVQEIQYEYTSSGIDRGLLRQISYPEGAVTKYTYDNWISGRRANPSSEWDTPREIKGVKWRDVYPNGLSAEYYNWGWLHKFEATQRDPSIFPEEDACIYPRRDEQWVSLGFPGSRYNVYELSGHPCNFINESWGPLGLVTEESYRVSGQSTAFLERSTTYDWENEPTNNEPVKAIRKSVRTCYSHGAAECRGEMSSDSYQRTDWNQWRMIDEWGDFTPLLADESEAHRYSYSNYHRRIGRIKQVFGRRVKYSRCKPIHR